jgi:ATP-dependent Clp protease protease subunit
MRLDDDDPRRWGPGRPAGFPPAGGDDAGSLAPWLEERLFDRRIVMLHGSLTSQLASRTAAALLTLDSLGPDPVDLHMRCPDGELDAVFAVVDALDLMKATVRALATAEIAGGAVGVYAVAPERKAFPHARFRLAEPRAAGLAGTADDVAHAAGQHLRALDDLIERIAAATGQPRSRVENDLSKGTTLDAQQALDYGLVHEIVERG